MTMLRKIPFTVDELETDISADGQDQTVPFRWFDTMLVLIKTTLEGAQGDEIIECYEIEEALRSARRAGDDHVLLTEDHWRRLRDRVNKWRFRFHGRAVVDFIKGIREAEKVEVEPKKTEV